VVLTILNVLPKSYKSFVQGVFTQETLPNFDQLTSRLLQEAQRKELHDDHTKTKEPLLLKFKQLIKKKKTNISKSSKHFCNCHKCDKSDHWVNSYPEPKKFLKNVGTSS
jgi:hypothetical protein